jgi:[ribosomal protein S5]-alanine N-acetyltransferase
MKKYRRMPVIDFDQYRLRTIKMSDAKDMFDYGKRSEVTRFLSWGPFTDIRDAKRSIRRIFFPRLKEGLPIGYAIVDLKRSKMIGTIDFHSKIDSGDGAEIGFVIHPDYWNKGIVTRALSELIQIGFSYLGYERVIVRHLKANVSSRRVIEKTGFRLIKREYYCLKKLKGTIEDEIWTYEKRR